jgi:hypothetical protein
MSGNTGRLTPRHTHQNHQQSQMLVDSGAAVISASPGGAAGSSHHHNNNNDDDDDGECNDAQCWMCLYQSDDEAKRLTEFIVRSVGYIDVFNISAQVSSFIHTRYKNAVDANGKLVPVVGADPPDVDRHIRKHILHPKVRIAVIIKELLEFQDHLHKNLVVEDVATGLTAVDKGNVELYLKVIAQITTLYKAETSTMLFGAEEGGNS